MLQMFTELMFTFDVRMPKAVSIQTQHITHTTGCRGSCNERATGGLESKCVFHGLQRLTGNGAWIIILYREERGKGNGAWVVYCCMYIT